MRYAIISDIHANLEAFRTVLTQISGLKADKTLCLGDIVGYNANPNECVDIMRSEGITGILGNHDARVAGLETMTNLNPLARRAIAWTIEQLTETNRDFLRGLPRELGIENFFICHGSIHDTNRYILTGKDLIDNFHALEKLPDTPQVGFFGHTHMKAAFSHSRGVVSLELSDDLLLSGKKKFLINPGSVGQPRDGDPRAAFVIYDNKDIRVTFHRIGYDITTTQEKIIKAGLPSKLAERLSLGW